MTHKLRDQLRHMPSSPGVYIFRDGDGHVLYVGKAKDLKKRVRQYFTGGRDQRSGIFVPLIDSVEIIVAGSEKEALLLESTLIKRFRPPFNVELKDDKSYPFFRVTIQEEFPRLELTRKVVKDGSLYFGPYTDAGAARKTLAWLEKAFPLRRCRGPRPGGRGRPGRPCLDHQMGRCLGPCGGEVDRAEYGRVVVELTSFLKGRGPSVTGELRKRMERASAEMRFEEAASLRDRMRAIETVLERQDVVGNPDDDLDILGCAASGGTMVLTCLFVRSGMLVGRSDLVLEGDPEPSHALEAFLTAHYIRDVFVPPRILLPVGIDFGKAHEEILSQNAGRKVRVLHPSRGRGARLVSLAVHNARQALDEVLERNRSAEELSVQVQKLLRLPSPVRRVECVDISHTSGKQTYGSTVVWDRGRLLKEHFRVYAIRSTGVESDDYAALAEVITRRFKGSSGSTMPTPDLLLVDGGKGQLSRAAEALRREGLAKVPLAAISKAGASKARAGGGVTDEIFRPGRSNPLKIPAHSPSLHLLQMLRDEAHRFALASHRRSRGREDLLSRLDGIHGVGPARRKALLTRFRSIEEIRAAPVEEIAALSGFNTTVAKRIKESLR
ncbi:MAG: excinuclease ABC subunit UvrC [bacterium]|nr:MAG: excinuclease ABC subunit UvrC [bacterium]